MRPSALGPMSFARLLKLERVQGERDRAMPVRRREGWEVQRRDMPQPDRLQQMQRVVQDVEVAVASIRDPQSHVCNPRIEVGGRRWRKRHFDGEVREGYPTGSKEASEPDGRQ